MRKMRVKQCKIYLFFVVLLGFALTFWEAIWSIGQHSLPSSFDIALLEKLSYVESAPQANLQDLSRRHGYHITNSRALLPDRDLPDFRPNSCGRVSSSVKHELPSPSVIVTFRNVERSILLRNVVSILTKSSPVTIRELILVDDGSINEQDGSLLSELPGVQVLRNARPEGRASARVKGLQAASGDVIVFVDALAEVNTDWLSPLLLRLLQSPKSIVSPLLDSVDHVTFEYHSLPGVFRGGFDWTLEFKWEDIPVSFNSDDKGTAPIRSPTLCGSVFAVRRDFFNWLGRYDISPVSSGVEDLELMLRAWMCGGQVEIIPCSRVGVVQAHGRDLGTSHMIFSNYLRGARRVAEVWLEEFKRYFYAVRPSARMQPLSNISGQRKLKERLKCKNFKWFLGVVYPQLQPLITDEVAYGSLRQGDNCVDLDPGQLPLVAKLRQCRHGKDSQEWSWRKRRVASDGSIAGVIVSNAMCLTSDLENMQGFVQVTFCKDGDDQIWYRNKNKIIHEDTSLCLDGESGNRGLMISECLRNKSSQHWEMVKEDTEVEYGEVREIPGVLMM